MKTAEQIKQEYTQGCRESAQRWMEIADKLTGELAAFAVRCAADALQTAQEWEAKSVCSICGKPLPAELPKVPKHYNLSPEVRQSILEQDIHGACCMRVTVRGTDQPHKLWNKGRCNSFTRYQFH